MASIRTLKDSNNNIIYPQTLTNAIFNLDNQTLDNLLASKANVNGVYTKDEVNSIISTLSSLKFEVVETLPALGSTDIIYLVPKADSEIQNTYDEYIYLENGTFEKIGDTTVDLSNYYNKTEADKKFAKASLYGDATINVGRRGDSEVGVCSTAEGYFTIASGNVSHAEGLETIAGSANQHVQGQCNIEDSNETYAHIVGNGTPLSRSNAHTLDWYGNSWYQGNIKCGGTSYDDAPNTVVTSGSVVKMWTGTQAQYDAITTKDKRDVIFDSIRRAC